MGGGQGRAGYAGREEVTQETTGHIHKAILNTKLMIVSCH